MTHIWLQDLLQAFPLVIAHLQLRGQFGHSPPVGRRCGNDLLPHPVAT